ncbi:MAG: hypothetical protein AAFQ67_06615 [Pseudomonadota bacterium]
MTDSLTRRIEGKTFSAHTARQFNGQIDYSTPTARRVQAIQAWRGLTKSSFPKNN